MNEGCERTRCGIGVSHNQQQQQQQRPARSGCELCLMICGVLGGKGNEMNGCGGDTIKTRWLRPLFNVDWGVVESLLLFETRDLGVCLFVLDVLGMDGESCVRAWIGRGCFALALMGCAGFLVDVVEIMVGCCLADLVQFRDSAPSTRRNKT